MNKVTINKSNWSGEKADLKLYADGITAAISEYNLKFKIIITSQITVGDSTYKEYKIKINDGNGWEETDWKARIDSNPDKYGSKFEASNWDYSISRSDEKDIRLAVAKLIFMVY